MTLNSRSAKLSSPNVKVQDVPNVPTIGTASQGLDTVDVSFTPAITGGRAAVYRAVSNPGGIEAISYGSSPVQVSGLNNDTAYTFTVRGETTTGSTTGYSSASNSITPFFSDYQLITSTVLTSTAGYVSFGSIPSTYKHLQLRVTFRNTEAITGLRGFFLRFNGDYSTTCSTHYVYGNGSGVLSGYQSDTRINAGGWQMMPTANLTSGAYFSGIIDIIDYASTTKNKTVKILGGVHTAGYYTVGLMSGMWPSTAAINEMNLHTNGDWAIGTRMSLYGIKG